MNNRKFTDAELKEALKAGITQKQFSIDHKVNIRTVETRKAKLVRQGWSPEHDLNHQVPDGFALKGTSTLYDENGKVKIQWVKSQVDKEKQLEIIKKVIKDLVDELPKVKPQKTITKNKINPDLLAVYPLGDPHIGMLAWEDETGNNWDLKIAIEVFCGVFARAIKSAPSCNEAVIVNLGDFFHYDNMEGTTSRSGNTLDVDGRYAKMVSVGVAILRQMVTTALEHHKTVRLINAIGNHDDTGAIFLSVCFSHIYADEPRVIVDTSPAVFNYYKFGKTLLGIHHGHTCKMANLPAVMACDKPKDWGDTKHRYWLTGHIHHDSKKEFPGCMVESFRTLAAKDAYAASGGWRSGQDTKCIIYHKEYGEVERHTINIDQMRDLDK